MRRRVLLQSLGVLVLACIALAVWMFGYHYLGGRSGFIFMAGVFVILLVVLLYLPRIDRQVVCPACGESLVDIECYDLFIKACPHCGVSYQPDK